MRPARYPDPEFTIQDLPARLLRVYSATVAEFLQERNRRAPSSRLPPELLAATFTFVPIPNRLFLGHVCRTWNTVLHAYPNIWSHVEYDGGFGSLDALERILAMSAQSDLHLDVTLSERGLAETCEAIRRHLHRCVTLRLVVRVGLPFEEASDALTAAISQPAPRLVTFRLFDHAGMFNAHRHDSVALFGNEAPRLELVKILCEIEAMRLSGETFRGVKHAMYSARAEISRADIQQLIRLCPDVEELSIDFDCWASESDSDPSEEGEIVEVASKPPLVLPQGLVSFLILPNTQDADPARFFSMVDTTRVPEVSVSYNLPSINDEDHLILGRLHALRVPAGLRDTASTHPFVARTISFESSTFSDHSIHIYMFETEMDVFQLVPQGTRLTDNERIRPGVERSVLDLGNQTPLEHTCFSNVVRLQMTEMVFDPEVIGSALPGCPALVHLTVYLMARNEHAEARFISGFVAAGSWPNRVLVCPRLETFRIGVDAWDREVRMEPCAVTKFVKCHLRYETPVLSKLLFNGVDLHVREPPEFEEMLGLADDVEWDSRHISWSFKHSELMDWR